MSAYFDKLVASCADNIFLMADIGLTCGGDLSRTLELINVAKETGFNGVKLQMLEAEKLLGDTAITYTYPTLTEGMQTEIMLDMFKKLEFSDGDWQLIIEHVRSLNMEPIVTCHYEDGVERVNRLNLNFNKICTWSLSHHRLIEMLASNGKPLIIDTGTINEEQLTAIKQLYRGSGGEQIIVLHDFHTDKTDEMNFAAMTRLKELNFIFGYTPQGRKDWLDFMSIGFGAQILEKRLTLSRSIPENGHWKAHEPEEISDWVKHVRECKKAIGKQQILPTEQDLRDAEKYYKSAWLVVEKKQGDIITNSDIVFKRPGTGISSADWNMLYKDKPFASRSLKGGTMLSREMLK